MALAGFVILADRPDEGAEMLPTSFVGEAHMGRPPKLTPEVHQRIVNNVKMGNYLKVSAEAAGVSAQPCAAG